MWDVDSMCGGVDNVCGGGSVMCVVGSVTCGGGRKCLCNMCGGFNPNPKQMGPAEVPAILLGNLM